MHDTPEHIKQLQLKIWLAKTPGERIIQFVKDNDAFYKLVDEMKASIITKQKDNK